MPSSASRQSTAQASVRAPVSGLPWSTASSSCTTVGSRSRAEQAKRKGVRWCAVTSLAASTTNRHRRRSAPPFEPTADLRGAVGKQQIGCARSSVLALRHAHHKPVEFGRDLDLAGQSAVRCDVGCEVEHGDLHVVLLRQLGEPGIVHEDMTGRAGAGAATIGVDAGYEILHRTFHNGPTGRHVHRMLLAAMFDVFDLRHCRSAQAMDFMGMEVSARRSGATLAPSAMSLRPTRYSGAALTASTAATKPSRR